ncbi:hypothetical protein [Streptomyces spirodelae]|uniref:Uncharacterized protein n=1 Tax=Streptomyces spirodelae TaxID=2812904 RepID=A0ABS3WYA3_9ACTN|nr:hypothetical protein [Streptomyces spirodelae]MBO8188117.1 hypothetical protein [Streptomyces spirodelae]
MVEAPASADTSGTRLFRLTDPAHTRRIYATRRTTDPNPFLTQALDLLRTAAGALPERDERECHAVTD